MVYYGNLHEKLMDEDLVKDQGMEAIELFFVAFISWSLDIGMGKQT